MASYARHGPEPARAAGASAVVWPEQPGAAPSLSPSHGSPASSTGGGRRRRRWRKPKAKTTPVAAVPTSTPPPSRSTSPHPPPAPGSSPGLPSPPSPLVRQQPTMPSNGWNSFGSVSSSLGSDAQADAPQEACAQDSESLSNAEDKYLLERRRVMPRIVAFSSLPNIFETPRKLGPSASHGGLLTPESPDDDDVRSGTQTPTPTGRPPGALALQEHSLDASSGSDTGSDDAPVFREAFAHCQDRDLPPTSAPGSIVHFPSSLPQSPTSTFGSWAAGAAVPHPSRPGAPLATSIAPEAQRPRDVWRSAGDASSDYLSSRCPTPLSQALPGFSFRAQGDAAGAYGTAWPDTPASLGSPFGNLPVPHQSHSHQSHAQQQPAWQHSLGEQTPLADESPYLLLWGLSPAEDVGLLQARLMATGDVRAIFVRFLASHGVVIVAYWDLRHAINAHRTLLQQPLGLVGHSPVASAFVWRQEVVKLVEPGDEGRQLLASNEGALTISRLGDSGSLTALGLQVTLGTFGDLRVFRAVGAFSNVWIAEYFDARAADRAITVLHGKRLEGAFLQFTSSAPATLAPPPLSSLQQQLEVDGLHHRLASVHVGGGQAADSLLGSMPDIRRSSMPVLPSEQPWLIAPTYDVRASAALLRASTGSIGHPVHPSAAMGFWPSPTAAAGAPRIVTRAQPSASADALSILGQLSLYQSQGLPTSGDVVLPVGTLSSPPAGSPEPQGPLSQQRRSNPAPHLPPTARGILKLLKLPQANQVDLDRLAQGLETRTSVMVQDIPNKMTRSMLLSIIHSTLPPGAIDFCYLRMDFANRCNVGYGFVNFSSTAHLLHFAREKMGRRWNLFASDKVLQLSFANIQSKQALVRKFQNSAVMLQPEEYRPVIFHSSGPLRGQREPFPSPTDLHRRESSLRAAQATGLYHQVPTDASTARPAASAQRSDQTD